MDSDDEGRKIMNGWVTAGAADTLDKSCGLFARELQAISF
jgi:hypothetical protein